MFLYFKIKLIFFIRTYNDFPSFHYEYASYMIEGIPGNPYGEDIETLLLVEENMKKR